MVSNSPESWVTGDGPSVGHDKVERQERTRPSCESQRGPEPIKLKDEIRYETIPYLIGDQ